MREKIQEVVQDVLKISDMEECKELDLLENDILDSFAFIQLISRLEKEFFIDIQPTQVPVNTWRKLDSIVAFVESQIEKT